MLTILPSYSRYEWYYGFQSLYFCHAGVYGPDQQLKDMPSHLSEIDRVALKIDPKDHTYPFENLVFEGGGSKGLACCGAVRVRHHGIYTVSLVCAKRRDCYVKMNFTIWIKHNYFNQSQLSLRSRRQQCSKMASQNHFAEKGNLPSDWQVYHFYIEEQVRASYSHPFVLL